MTLRPCLQPGPLRPAVCLEAATSSPCRASPTPALGTGLGAPSPWSTASWGLCLSNLSPPTAALRPPAAGNSGSPPASSPGRSPRCRELSRRQSPQHLPTAGLRAFRIGPMSTWLVRSPRGATLRGSQGVWGQPSCVGWVSAGLAWFPWPSVPISLGASQVAQTVKSSPPMQMWLRSLG